MQRYSDVIVDPDGQVLDGATVAVYDSAGNLATIYADAASTFKANPFTAGTDTEYSFYAANGIYSITTTLSGYHPKTVSDVLLYDPEDDPKDASSIEYDDTADYPDNSIGAALAGLFALASTVEGEANEIVITDDGNGTLTFGLSPTAVAPGSLAVTGQLSGGGTATNDDAAAGDIGEFVYASTAKASAVALTSGATADVASISLAAGDWEVSGVLSFTGAATSVTYWAGGANTTSATLPPDEHLATTLGRSAAMPVDPAFPIVGRRITINATTTVYLVARAGFTGGACSAFGAIRARRVR